jgi:ribosome-interacting GTPase 1
MTSLDYLIERIWESLGLVKVYTKKRGARPDLSDPVCLRKGATIEVRNLALMTYTPLTSR